MKVFKFVPKTPDGILQNFFVFPMFKEEAIILLKNQFERHWYAFNAKEYDITEHDIFYGQWFATPPNKKHT